VPIEHAQAKTLIIAAVNLDTEGTYTCRVYNSAGNVESAPTLVQFQRAKPVITSQPVSAAIEFGKPAELVVRGAWRCLRVHASVCCGAALIDVTSFHHLDTCSG
jgi:hypothetical protein